MGIQTQLWHANALLDPPQTGGNSTASYKISAVTVDCVCPMSDPTNSQLTLVDGCGPGLPGENIVLIFDRDDMKNTTLRIRADGLPSYFVETHDNITTVYAGDTLLATVTRRTVRRDQITFPGSRPMNLGGWLKAPILSTLPLVFHACGRWFEWRKDFSEQLVLHEPSRPDDTVAWFSKSRVGHGNHVIHAAHLAIKREMDEVRDMIVLSCLLAEHKLRVIDVMSDERVKATTYSLIF